MTAVMTAPVLSHDEDKPRPKRRSRPSSAEPSTAWLSRPVAILGALVLLATAFGGWRAVSLATSPHLAPNSIQVGDVTYTVTHAEQVQGLSDADLSGMGHGIQGLVTDDKALIRVSVVVKAGKGRAVYHPEILKAFRSGSTTPLDAVGGSLSPGALQAHGQVEGQLSYIVPRDGAQLTLRAGSDPRQVQLLQVDSSAPAAGGDSHSGTHHTSGTTK